MKKLLFVLFIFFAVAVSGCAGLIIPYAIEGAGLAGSFFSSQRKNSPTSSTTVTTVGVGEFTVVIEIEKRIFRAYDCSGKNVAAMMEPDEKKFARFTEASLEEKKNALREGFLKASKFDLLPPRPPVAYKAEPPTPQAETLSFRKFSGEIPPTAGFH